ncbi:MAG TPA: TonB family protein, partial [Kofleriaceae bacterium]|nr:TonB family protein [Kofleriaceae bacterium]
AAAPPPPPTAAPPPIDEGAKPAPAPVATNISMGNDTGMDLGTGHPTGPDTTHAPTSPKQDHAKPAAAAVKTPIKIAPPPPPTGGGDAPCTEPPGKPEPVVKTEIEYIEEARAAGIEGRLVLKVTVDEHGNVTDVTVVSGVDGALDAAAVATVKTWRFKPAMACGKPVAGGTYTIARRFVLGD